MTRYVGEKISLFPVSEMANFYIITDRKNIKPIGFCGISECHELIGLFIEPKYRRKGFATDLIKVLENYFAIRVTTSVKNTPMQKLMEKMGYTKLLKYQKVNM